MIPDRAGVSTYLINGQKELSGMQSRLTQERSVELDMTYAVQLDLLVILSDPAHSAGVRRLAWGCLSLRQGSDEGSSKKAPGVSAG